eukprot:4003073-Pleurochrysis_carterae.AAC.1
MHADCQHVYFAHINFLHAAKAVEGSCVLVRCSADALAPALRVAYRANCRRQSRSWSASARWSSPHNCHDACTKRSLRHMLSTSGVMRRVPISPLGENIRALTPLDLAFLFVAHWYIEQKHSITRKNACKHGGKSHLEKQPEVLWRTRAELADDPAYAFGFFSKSMAATASCL